MPKWLKIVLLVGGLLFLSFFAMCGACAFMGYDVAKDVMEESPKAIAEAERDALDTDQAGCMDNALERGAACEKLGPLDAGKCQALTKIYAKACLADAKETQGFCDDLPPQDFMAMTQWAVQRCQDLGREPGASCGQVVQVVLEHCGVYGAPMPSRAKRGPGPPNSEPIELSPPAPPASDPEPLTTGGQKTK